MFAKVVWDNDGLVKHINNTQTRDASWIKQYVATLLCLLAVIHFFFNFSVQQECRWGKWIRCTQEQWWICLVFSCLICCRRLWLAYPLVGCSTSRHPLNDWMGHLIANHIYHCSQKRCSIPATHEMDVCHILEGSWLGLGKKPTWLCLGKHLGRGWFHNVSDLVRKNNSQLTFALTQTPTYIHSYANSRCRPVHQEQFGGYSHFAWLPWLPPLQLQQLQRPLEVAT